MKNIQYPFIVLILLYGNILCQNIAVTKESIIGVWQIGNSGIASGLNDIYIFDSKGNFTYRLNEMENNLKKIIGIKGKYSIKEDSINIKITHTIEILNGYIDCMHSSINIHGWAYFGDKEILKKYLSKYDSFTLLIKYRKDTYNEIITVGFNDYYLLSKDPAKKRF